MKIWGKVSWFAAALGLFVSPAFAATTLVSPVATLATVSHQWVSSLSSAGVFSTSQPAVGDLANVAGGTILGNATGAAAAPTATASPVLGIGASTAGTLGLANGGASGVTVTMQNPSATTAYNFNLPATVGVAGQALVSEGGGSTAMSWSNILSSTMTIVSKTTSYTLLSADDWHRFDDSGAAGAVTFNLTAALAVGDNWCFTQVGTNAVTLADNSITSMTIHMAPVGAGTATTGTLVSQEASASACVYMETATDAYVYSSLGGWQLT